MTTIQWLRKELETIPNYSAFYTNNYTWIDSIMNEAKEMEKQKIIDAFDTGFERWNDGAEHYLNSEDYYQKTFKNTNKCGQSEM